MAKRLDSAIETIDELERRDPKAAEFFDFRNKPFDEAAIQALSYIPKPARRPKGLNPETERQLRRMDELLRSGEARSPTEAAKRAAQDHRITANLKTRADHLVNLWKKRQSRRK